MGSRDTPLICVASTQMAIWVAVGVPEFETFPPPLLDGRIAAAACNALVTFCAPPVIVRAVLKQY
jgi:hypothetical protein